MNKFKFRTTGFSTVTHLFSVFLLLVAGHAIGATNDERADALQAALDKSRAATGSVGRCRWLQDAPLLSGRKRRGQTHRRHRGGFRAMVTPLDTYPICPC